MKTFFIFFSICIVSTFASTPWLNENSTDSGISEGDIAFEDSINMEIIDAAEVGNETAVRKLLNEGADVNARKIRIKYLNITRPPTESEKIHENINSMILAHDANVKGIDNPLGEAAIHKAALNGNANIVSLLLAHNVSVEMKGEYNKTPLHYAAHRGHANVVSLLLDKGANIEARGLTEKTPLHYAAEDGHANVVSILLDRGADIEARSTSDWTPLHYAAVSGHANVISLLLDKGGNIEAKGRWFGRYSTPLYLAQRGYHTETVEILERKERQLSE